MMTRERWLYLMQHLDEGLTQQEIDEGWHFCYDWDGLLVHKDDPEAAVCQCRKEKGKR